MSDIIIRNAGPDPEDTLRNVGPDPEKSFMNFGFDPVENFRNVGPDPDEKIRNTGLDPERQFRTAEPDPDEKYRYGDSNIVEQFQNEGADPEGGEVSFNQGSRFYVYYLTCFATIGGLLFGYDTGIISGSMLLIGDNMKLTNIWKEAIVSATVGAAAIFALVAGFFTDYFGRKKVVMLGSVIFTAGAVVMCASPNKYVLLVGRLIVGTGLGRVFIRLKSGHFEHQVNSDMHLQTVKIQMRRLLMSRLIRVFTVC